jgi:hypothetical protein
VHKTAALNVAAASTKSQKNAADWIFTVAKDDVSKSLDRLDDILILCHYNVKEKQV